MNKKGLTLIEIIIAILIVGLAFYSIIKVFAAVMPQNFKTEDISRATFLANMVMEETTVKSFSSISSVSQTSFSSPFAQYKYKVDVAYLSESDPSVTSVSTTDVKRVITSVWGQFLNTVEVFTIVGTYEM